MQTDAHQSSERAPAGHGGGSVSGVAMAEVEAASPLGVSDTEGVEAAARNSSPVCVPWRHF